MAQEDPIVIVGMARTPMGGFQGALTPKAAPELGSAAIKGALADAKITGDDVDATVMGCVLPAGLGQAPARQASLFAGIPKSSPCTTVNKMCGSGMQAVMFAHDTLAAGSHEVMVAGGMESMTNAPYLLKKARGGMRIGHDKILDHMYLDGLEDAYEGKLMGVYADESAAAYQFTREDQDSYALASLERAQKAIAEERFTREVIPVEVKTRKGAATVAIDEQPGNARPDKIPGLKPAFVPNGTVTAANSSSISDGAAALVMMRASEADKRGLKPLAKIVGHSVHADEPGKFTSAPVGAMQKLFDKTGWSAGDVDLFEVNEAFAVVALIAMKEHGIPHEKINVHGGACALGHPIGASGARILITLLAALETYGLSRGVASLCIGGGEATAVAIERAA